MAKDQCFNQFISAFKSLQEHFRAVFTKGNVRVFKPHLMSGLFPQCKTLILSPCALRLRAAQAPSQGLPPSGGTWGVDSPLIRGDSREAAGGLGGAGAGLPTPESTGGGEAA